MKTKCNVDSCENEARAKGLCNKHYTNAIRNGGLIRTSSVQVAVLLQKEQEIMKLKEALSAAEKENQPLKERIKELEERLADQEEKLSDHEKRISTLEEEKSVLVDKNSALAYVIETLKGS